jgi:hypothetical protein
MKIEDLKRPALPDLEFAFQTLVGELSRHEKPSGRSRWMVISGDGEAFDLTSDPVGYALKFGLKRLGRAVVRNYGPEALEELVFRHSGRRSTKIAGVEFGPDGGAA